MTRGKRGQQQSNDWVPRWGVHVAFWSSTRKLMGSTVAITAATVAESPTVPNVTVKDSDLSEWKHNIARHLGDDPESVIIISWQRFLLTEPP